MALSDASSPAGTLAAWNEDGQLFLVVGAFTALLSWFVLPIAGLVSVYCGLGLWTEHDRTIAGGAIAVVGGLGVVMWVAFLVSIWL